jgi:hypothetical protein
MVPRYLAHRKEKLADIDILESNAGVVEMVISFRAILPEQRPSSTAPIAFKTNSPRSILSRTC